MPRRRLELTNSVNDIRLFQRRLLRWFGCHGRDFPWRRTRDPYAILVSEYMLQQTQVATVIPYFEGWLERFPDFATLARAEEADVLHAWAGLGYYARARHLHAAAKFATNNFGGQLPDEVATIAQLPGVGRYTAGAVASFAFDQAEPIVDANIARVLARLTNLQISVDTAAGRAQLWQNALALLPRTGGRLHNSALMELALWFACLVAPSARNARFDRFARRPIQRSCRAKKRARVPSDSTKRTVLCSGAIVFSSNNPPPAGVGCGFCQGSRRRHEGSRCSNSTFPSPITASLSPFSRSPPRSCLTSASVGSR